MQTSLRSLKTTEHGYREQWSCSSVRFNVSRANIICGCPVCIELQAIAAVLPRVSEPAAFYLACLRLQESQVPGITQLRLKAIALEAVAETAEGLPCKAEVRGSKPSSQLNVLGTWCRAVLESSSLEVFKTRLVGHLSVGWRKANLASVH